jgi:hypothetical protein
VRLAWLVVATLAMVCCRPAWAEETDAYGEELFSRLPLSISGAFSFEDATALRTSEVGESIRHWMTEHDALAETRRAWSLLSERLGVSGVDAFDGLLGGSTVIAFDQRDGEERIDWIVLAAVDTAMDVRLLQRTRAVPRKLAYGRAVLGLEEESFLLATLPPLRDGRSVLVLAPSKAEWLLLRTLAVSAGKAEPVDAGVLRTAPTDAVVRGYWEPSGAAGLFGDIEAWFWGPTDQMQRVAVWARTDAASIEIGLSPTEGRKAAELQPVAPTEGVLLDVVGPGTAIVSSVLERAGLTGIVPEGLLVTRRTGELVVRRGPDGIDLGARLPLQEPVAHAVGMAEPPMGEAGQVRLRSLSETRSSRAIFGPKPQLAWTLLTKDPGRAKLLVAVAAGRTRSFAEDQDPKPVAVHIVGQAIDRPSPKTPGVHGAARPHEIWGLLSAITREGKEPRDANAGISSVLALLDQASWAVEVAPDAVRGRIVLELREASAR